MSKALLRNDTRVEDLEAAIAVARARYTAVNPLSAERHRRACAALPGGNTRSVLHYAPFPLAFARAEGATLWSADGQKLTDMLGEFTAGLFGHSHPVIHAALHGALEGGINFGGHTMSEARLAELMRARFPSLDRVRFTNTGTEANLMAVATAVAITERREVMVFHGGYHGAVFSFANGSAPLNAPYDFVIGTYNDVAGTRRLLRERGNRLAAILVEPMLGSGGCIPATREFLHMLRQEATASAAVLVFDEVMTSRFAPGGLQAVHSIAPDMTTFGKYLGGGMTFGAFGGREAIMARFDPSRADALFHAGTFNNNVLSMAGGIAALSEVYTAVDAAALDGRGEALKGALNDVLRDAGVGCQFTGYGSLMTFHAVAGPVTSPADLVGADPAVKELLFFDLLADDFWIARRGMITLSLAVTDDDCDRLVDAFAAFIRRHAALLPA